MPVIEDVPPNPSKGDLVRRRGELWLSQHQGILHRDGSLVRRSVREIAGLYDFPPSTVMDAIARARRERDGIIPSRNQ
jgi:hypothetical protein